MAWFWDLTIHSFCSLGIIWVSHFIIISVVFVVTAMWNVALEMACKIAAMKLTGISHDLEVLGLCIQIYLLVFLSEHKLVGGRKLQTYHETPWRTKKQQNPPMHFQHLCTFLKSLNIFIIIYDEQNSIWFVKCKLIFPVGYVRFTGLFLSTYSIN